ncbi:MAG: SUMF1/EgtB/PvdO family nonheme iron enzyme, partial [Bacteroidota bacterium]
ENLGDQSGPIPAPYPKGFAAFWSMKYEITEDQFVSFFNTLTNGQKVNNDPTGPDGKNTDAEFSRNTLAWTSGNMTTLAPERAVSFLTYESCAAYLDWAGLRFMTELEFEKAAKGPTHTVDMFASGSPSVFDGGIYTIDNDGSANAIITNHGENITNMTYFITDQGGPDRVGIHAASSVNNTREETGGSYYGIMELSGNVYERLIGIGTPINRAYDGSHGDGELTGSGFHNVVSWPANGSEGAHSYRGGSWANDVGFCRIADRNSACILNSVTNGRIGIRGGRSGQ